jgi:SAM-dependent methyltransferase
MVLLALAAGTAGVLLGMLVQSHWGAVGPSPAVISGIGSSESRGSSVSAECSAAADPGASAAAVKSGEAALQSEFPPPRQTYFPPTSALSERMSAMYIKYPYPYFHPSMDAAEVPSEYDATGLLGVINHWGFNGERRSFEGFRVLSAGCGTGNTIIGLAHLLRDVPGVEIVAVDLSERSLNITRSRAERFGLAHLFTFHRMSLLDLTEAQCGGRFDYVQSHGVIHHLDCADGLAALRGVLKPDGVMSLMFYGRLGRSGITQAQEMMRRASKGLPPDDFTTRIAAFRVLWPQLPPTNALKAINLFPREMDSDEGVVDMILHIQEQCFSVLEVYAMMDQAGLPVRAWDIANRAKMNRVPEGVDLAALSERELHAFNELFWGDLAKHTFTCGMSTADPVSPKMFLRSEESLDMVVDLHFADAHALGALCDRWEHRGRPAVLEDAGLALKFTLPPLGPQDDRVASWVAPFDTSALLKVPLSGPSCAVLRALDGKRTLRRTFDALEEATHMDTLALLKHFEPTFNALLQFDILLLRTPIFSGGS